ncbi:MAG: WD40/YVTN/BNR-like repeat-containing protein [Candidatus Xenobiia bacterium LiM19]
MRWYGERYTKDGGLSMADGDTGGADGRAVSFVNSSSGFLLVQNKAVYISLDGGKNWPLSLGAPEIPESRALQFFDTVNGFAAGHRQLWRARDRGDGQIEWLKKTDGGVSINDICFKSTSTGWLAGNTDTALDGAVIYKTTDGGDTVNSLYSVSPEGAFYSLSFPSGTCGWVGGATSGDALPLVAHTEDGTAWTAQTVDDARVKGIYGINFPKGNIKYGWAVGKGGGLIIRTCDGGKTWTAVDPPVDNDAEEEWVNADAYAVFFTSVTTGWIADIEGNIWKCTLTEPKNRRDAADTAASQVRQSHCQAGSRASQH